MSKALLKFLTGGLLSFCLFGLLWSYLTAVPAQAAPLLPPAGENLFRPPSLQGPTGTVPTATFPPIILDSVEPRQMSSETGGTLTVFGFGFTEATVVRLIGYGLLSTTYVNPHALTAVVPPGVPPATYGIHVGVGPLDGPGAVLSDAVQILAPTATPKPTNTPAPTNTPLPTDTPTPVPFVFGQPQIAIELATTEPALLRPGESFILTLALANVGNYTAIDVTAILQSTDLAIPIAGSNVRILPRIGIEETVTMTLPLVLSDTVGEGPRNLAFAIEFFDLDGRAYNTQQSIGLTIGQADPTATPTTTPDPAQPRLVLTTYFVTPETALQPGGVFDLTLNITNVGDAAARNVVLTLGGEGGQQLAPFALLNSGNLRFIATIAANETIEVVQKLIVDGTADSGFYTLPIDFSYDDEQATPLTAAQVINLLIEEQPQFRISFYRPVAVGMVDQPLDLPVEVVNIGRNLVNVSTLTITSLDMQVDNNAVYIGPLDGSTSGSLEAIALPQTSGELLVEVTVNYLDDFNQPQIYMETLTVQVEEPFQPIDAPGSEESLATAEAGAEETFLDSLWRFVRGMLGLGS